MGSFQFNTVTYNKGTCVGMVQEYGLKSQLYMCICCINFKLFNFSGMPSHIVVSDFCDSMDCGLSSVHGIIFQARIL